MSFDTFVFAADHLIVLLSGGYWQISLPVWRLHSGHQSFNHSITVYAVDKPANNEKQVPDIYTTLFLITFKAVDRPSLYYSVECHHNTLYPRLAESGLMVASPPEVCNYR